MNFVEKKLNKLLRRGRRHKNKKQQLQTTTTTTVSIERLEKTTTKPNLLPSTRQKISNNEQTDSKRFFRVWIIVNLRSLAHSLQLHVAKWNSKPAIKPVMTPCVIKTNLPLLAAADPSPITYQESVGCESGYLSGRERHGSSSGYESTEMSPLSPHRDFPHASLRRRSSEGILITASPAKRWYRAPGLPPTMPVEMSWCADDTFVFDTDGSLAFLKARVRETKYVTTIFQMSAGGIENIVGDVIDEFSRWFGTESSLLGIACEVHWSVPQKARERRVERRLKDGLHSALRNNNRRVLGIQNHKGDHLPLTLAEASTEENCEVNQEFNNFQGVYQRYYSSLLPIQHAETKLWHQSYWSFNKNHCKPQPQQFIKAGDGKLLREGSVVAVLISARAIFQEGKSDSRLLYVDIIDENDNEPVFAQKTQETPYLFIVNKQHEPIGKVTSTDADSEPLNHVYYYLLPSCSNRKGDFSIDHETGEVRYIKPAMELRESRTHLCALASPVPDLGPAPEIAFDRHNLSMTSITVRQMDRITQEQRPADPIIVFKNNSHVTLDSSLMDVGVPVTNTSATENLLSYRITNVNYTKAEYDENDDVSQKLTSLFSLSPTTGDLHIDTDLVTHPEGIYRISVEANEKATNKYFASMQSAVHFVNSNVKLKFVFEQSRDVIGLNLAEFEQKLTRAVRSEGLGSDLTIYLGRPEVYKDADGINANKSIVCFYVVRGSTILSLEHAIEAVSASANSDCPLTRLYQVYKVVNIDRCSDSVTSRRIGQFLSPYTIVWIIIILVCLLILMAMFGYMCFLTRYRDHLKRKELNFAARIEKRPPVDDFTVPQYININLNQ